MRTRWGAWAARVGGLALAVLGAASAVTAAAPGLSVYVVNGLTRVRPDTPPRKAPSVSLQAARNEYEPFQVVVRAGTKPLVGVSLRADDLRGSGGRFIPRRHVALYREHYVRVTQPSYRSKAAPGLYPDALIPFTNPTTGRPLSGGRFAAAPFDVEPNTNQPVWVEVYVPKATPPGRYNGALWVTARAQKPVKVPVILTVWPFTLPDTPSLRSNFGGLGSRVAGAHRVTAQSAAFRPLERQYAAALIAHRLCAPVPAYLLPPQKEDGSVDAAAPDSALREWMGRFRPTGIPLPIPGSDPLGKDREHAVNYLRSLYAYLKARGWEKLAYVYVLDEPNTAAQYEEVRQRARLVHEAAPDLKVLCTEQPKPSDPAWGTLVGSVDIWVPLWPLWDGPTEAQRLAAGDELWSYTALCQGQKETPFWELDFPLLNYRIPAWMSWRYGATGLLYWTTVYWQKAGDVWTQPATYGEGNTVFNGEGMLLYPGADVGYPGPVASLRLKQLREGLEDYEYLRLLDAKRGKPTADAMARELARSWTDWDRDPNRVYALRRRIAAML